MLKEGFLFTFISAFMALFPVANPVGAGFLVNGLLSGLNDEDRRSIIRRIVTDYLLVGLGSLAVGHFVLSLFGLSLPVIQLGGGLLICRTALQWLGDSDSSVGRTQGKDVNPIHKSAIESQIFYPITFPISIGPGSVSVILTLMASVSMKNGWARGLLSYAIIAVVIVLMCLILYLFLSQGERIIRKIGNSGSIVINKMVAFFTFCVGVQIVDGVVLLAGKAEEPVAGGEGRDVCLIHSADWKCTDDPLVAALHRFCIVLIKRASLLIDQDSVLM